MEQKSSRKRHFLDDEDSDEQPMQKRIRFPKGKKVKPGKEAVDGVKDDGDGPTGLKNPQLAAKERATRRNLMTFELCSEESRGNGNDISAAEVTYEVRICTYSFLMSLLSCSTFHHVLNAITEGYHMGDENFVDDGIQIDPFNLDKEREEGYFDAEGNFVEYVNENEIKDAWLDSLEVDQRYVGTAVIDNKVIEAQEDKDNDHELSSEELGVIKRRIANILEPGETVTQALRRLKGTSNKKEKMSAETKRVFDQLTEDAMRLMEENGEYNVYHENRETFEREAEGYERLAQSKEKADAYDMFADDDEAATVKPSSDERNTVLGPNLNAASQSSSDALSTASESLQNDYVYDESSGYYYSSSLGYYYDPSTGLYCSAVSGQWYSFNEETGTYEQVNADASREN
ncbi:hypothetical protein CICLE_v10025761mg [Citrus x clementina]|uniref:OCRE domain-containing protein n=1 Tax=Citrus clementina TaxID=85681 RepID=V4UPF2_CITCL|nr:hypothetical protein CICLE_v10025761mg [Citrus x clementina]